MKVAIIVDSYYPVWNSCARLIYELSSEFHSLGHEVTILTISDQARSKLEVTSENGITVLRVQTGKTKGANRIERALNEMRLSQSVWRAAGGYLGEHPHDLITFYSPTIFWGWLVGRLRALWSCPAYLILRDVFPDWAHDTGQMSGGPVFWYFRRRAMQQFQVADVIGVETESGRDYLRDCYPAVRSQVEVLNNWTRMDEVEAPDPEFRLNHGLESKTIFFYGGNIGVAQDMNNLLTLADRLRSRSDIQFIFVGRGSEVDRIKALIASGNAPNVTLVDSVPEKQYLGMLAASDIGLISLDRRLKSRNVPGKLLGYLKQGIPVLASVNPNNDLFAMIEGAGVGLCSITGDNDLLVQNALQLADDRRLRHAMASNTRKLLQESFSVRHAAEQIMGVLTRRAEMLRMNLT